MLDREEQPSNILLGTAVRLFPMTAAVSAVQLLNVLAPMVVILSGISTDKRLVQFLNT